MRLAVYTRLTLSVLLYWLGDRLLFSFADDELLTLFDRVRLFSSIGISSTKLRELARCTANDSSFEVVNNESSLVREGSVTPFFFTISALKLIFLGGENNFFGGLKF